MWKSIAGFLVAALFGWSSAANAQGTAEPAGRAHDAVVAPSGGTAMPRTSGPNHVPAKLTGPLYNLAGVEIRPADLKFLIEGELQHGLAGYSPRVLVGLQANRAYYYVWVQRRSWRRYELYAHGRLFNQSGQEVPVDSLAFAVLADLDDDGNSDLVGLQSNTTWMYAWSLAACPPLAADQPACYAPLYPVHRGQNWNGHLTNRSGTRVLVDELEFVEAGNWTGVSAAARRTQIRALHRGNAFQYTWSLDQGRVANWQWHLADDGYLRDVNGAPVPVDHIRFVHRNRRDPHNSNVGGQRHQLIAIVDEDDTTNPHDGWYMVWEDGENAVRQVPLCKNAAHPCGGKSLVFSLDQGAVNGLVANADRPQFDPAMDRIIALLQRFQTKFDVYALVSPTIRADLRHRLIHVLDRLHAAQIPFLFDVYASDVGSMSTRQPRFSQSLCTSPSCPEWSRYTAMLEHPTGQTNDPAYLDYYTNRYGAGFAGMRVFEILSLHWSAWVENGCVAPPRTAYDRHVVTRLLQFAQRNGMFLFWTDNKWHNPFERYHACHSWTPINTVRSDAVALAALYPNTVILGFSNNEGVRRHGDGYYPRNYRLGNWHSRLAGVGQLRGTGLSNQTWTTDNHRMLFDETLPAEEFAIWICDAFQRHDVELVQLEPSWYLFRWDRQELRDWLSAKDLSETSWTDAGKPTDSIRIVAELLGVDLSGL